MKTEVSRFWLQPTTSFPEEEGGAPAREEYLTDRSFHEECLVYDREWREMYFHKGKCKNRDCPQCWPHPQTFAEYKAMFPPEIAAEMK